MDPAGLEIAGRTEAGGQEASDNTQEQGITVAQFDKYLSVEPTRS